MIGVGLKPLVEDDPLIVYDEVMDLNMIKEAFRNYKPTGVFEVLTDRETADKLQACVAEYYRDAYTFQE